MAKRVCRRRNKPEPVEFRPPALPVKMIISGGQTGVDRAALEAAIKLNIPHGGWCPRGRLAEDGRIPRQFKMKETESIRYFVRTERNVKEADGTLILFRTRLTGGTSLTYSYARRLRKPCLIVDLARGSIAEQIAKIRTWLITRRIQILNIAGPRESSSPGVFQQAKSLLHDLLRPASRPVLQLRPRTLARKP